MRLPDICPHCQHPARNQNWTFIGKDTSGEYVFLCSDCATALMDDHDRSVVAEAGESEHSSMTKPRRWSLAGATIGVALVLVAESIRLALNGELLRKPAVALGYPAGTACGTLTAGIIGAVIGHMVGTVFDPKKSNDE